MFHYLIILPLSDVVLFSCCTILMVNYVILHYFDIAFIYVELFNVALFDVALCLNFLM